VEWAYLGWTEVKIGENIRTRRGGGKEEGQGGGWQYGIDATLVDEAAHFTCKYRKQ
jgi:hypothetical protein